MLRNGANTRYKKSHSRNPPNSSVMPPEIPTTHVVMRMRRLARDMIFLLGPLLERNQLAAQAADFEGGTSFNVSQERFGLV